MNLSNLFSTVFKKYFPLVIILTGIGISSVIANNPPQTIPQAGEKGALLVSVLKADLKAQRVQVSGFGVIQAKKKQAVIMQVAGVVRAQNSELVVGGSIDKSALLLQLDTYEYEMKLVQAKAVLASAQSALTDELGLQSIGKRDWDRMTGSAKKGELQKRLVLRIDKLEASKAALASAKSSQGLVQLDLDRTLLTAQCDGFVESESIEAGQVVKVGEQVATIVCSDTFEVVTNISLEDLQWLTFSDKEGKNGSKVEVVQSLGTNRELVKAGRLSRLLGTVDPVGRMAQVVVEIDQPLDGIPLLVGTYVEVKIAGISVNEVAQLPRSVVHENNLVWLVDNKGQLAFRQVDVLFGQNDQLYINGGISEGDTIVSSYIATPLKGMQLRIEL